MKGQENFKKTAALSLIIAFGMTPATGVLADSTGDASNDITSEYTAEQSDALEVMTFASVAEEFVIENGVLKKYNGTAADVVIPSSVSKIGDEAFKCIQRMPPPFDRKLWEWAYRNGPLCIFWKRRYVPGNSEWPYVHPR